MLIDFYNRSKSEKRAPSNHLALLPEIKSPFAPVFLRLIEPDTPIPSLIIRPPAKERSLDEWLDKNSRHCRIDIFYIIGQMQVRWYWLDPSAQFGSYDGNVSPTFNWRNAVREEWGIK